MSKWRITTSTGHYCGTYEIEDKSNDENVDKLQALESFAMSLNEKDVRKVIGMSYADIIHAYKVGWYLVNKV